MCKLLSGFGDPRLLLCVWRSACDLASLCVEFAKLLAELGHQVAFLSKARLEALLLGAPFGDFRRQLRKAVFDRLGLLLRDGELLASVCCARVGGALSRLQHLAFSIEPSQHVACLRDELVFARGILFKLIDARLQFLFALSSARCLALEIFLLDPQPSKNGGALGLFGAQRIHTLRKLRLLGQCLAFGLRHRAEFC